MKKPLLFAGLALFFALSCMQAPEQPGAAPRAPATGAPTVFKILPLGNPDKAFTSQCAAALEKYAGKVIVLPAEQLPPQAFYAPRNRYRADTLISWMTARARPGEVYVGITQKDISTGRNGYPDFGIMGLAFQPGRACVVSSFRLKNKRNVYKVALHEAAHAAGLPHCPVTTCFVRDAKGGDPTGEETGFCASCTRFLQHKGWRL